MQTIVAMVQRADEENKIETVDSMKNLGNVKMSRAGKGQETVTRDPDFWETDCQGCKGKDTVCKSGSRIWCTKCGMGAQEQAQPQGKQMSGGDKALQEGVSLESTKEVIIRGEVTGVDTSGDDRGDLDKAKIARARAERKTAKQQERDRKAAKKYEDVKAQNEKYYKEQGEFHGEGSIKKVIAAHGPFRSRYVKGSRRECVVCDTCSDSGKAQECYYCPEKIYCTRSCQAEDWPEHKKNCRMGEGDTESRIREPQVLKGTQQEREKGKTGKNVQAEQGEVKVKMCSVGEETKTVSEAFDQWCHSLIYEEVSEREQMEIEAHLMEMERDLRVEEQEETRVLKAITSEGISDGEKAKTFKTKTQGLCVTCDLEGEVKCATCSGVYCSVECHRKKGQCPSEF